MIVHDLLGTVEIDWHRRGKYFAEGSGCLDWGDTPHEALLNWRKLVQTSREMEKHFIRDHEQVNRQKLSAGQPRYDK